MRNKHKRYSILLLGLALLLASSGVACGECYTQEDLDAAREEAYAEGYDIGNAEGYEAGYDVGLAEGESNKEKAVKQAYDKGYWSGYENAQGEGYDRGYADGYRQGKAEGLDHGRQLGYAEGWKACRSVCDDGTQQGKYVGSKNSDVYHYPWCRYVEQIHTENKIWFSSASDARAHGYRPCKVCCPP